MTRYSFRGKTCVVTGAGRGLGKAVADLFVEAGANVAYISRTAHSEVLDRLAAQPERAQFWQADVSVPEHAQRTFDEVHTRFGSLDILVNNAGIAQPGPFEEISPDVWDEVMANNVRSYFLCTQRALKYMEPKRYGKIVNVSSIAGRDKSLLLGCAYTASKAAIIGLTRHVASEVAAYGINVNCVCPGPVRTPMLESALPPDLERNLVARIPLGYIAEPQQVAAVVLFLASDDASYMTGAVVDINGGLL